MAEGGKKLSEEEIYLTLKHFNVPFKKNDLTSPTREFIARVFECFLKDLQIDITSPDFRPWEASGHIEDTDIYEDAQLFTLLSMTVNYITYPLKLDITVKDIIEPKPKRTKKILNYILVFWTYYFQKYVRFVKIEESCEEDRKKAEDLILENECLDEKYNEINKILESKQSKEELVRAVSAKEEKINKFEKQKEELLADYNSLKTKLTNMQNNKVATEVSIVTEIGRLEELGQLILSSPERLNTEIKRLKDRIKAEDVKIKEKENILKDNEKKLQLQERSLKDNEKISCTLNNVISQINSFRDVVIAIVADQEKIEEEEKKLKNLQTDIQQKREILAHQKQKSLKVVINTKKQAEAYMTLLERYQSDETKEGKILELIKSEVDKMQEQIESTKKINKKIFEKSVEANANGQNRIAQYRARMEEANKRFKFECDSIVNGVKQKFPGII